MTRFAGLHFWIVKKWIGYPTCRLCGVVKRKDSINRPCRGLVFVRPREAP